MRGPLFLIQGKLICKPVHKTSSTSLLEPTLLSAGQVRKKGAGHESLMIGRSIGHLDKWQSPFDDILYLKTTMCRVPA